MRFFFDDSGDFSIHGNLENEVSLWMGLGIPETCIERLEKKYLDWEYSTKTRLKVPELKGSSLDESGRDLFFEMIENENDILVQPAIVDHQIQQNHMAIDFPAAMRHLGIEASKRMVSKKDQDILDLHGRMLGNLSAVQLLKFIVLSFCIVETLRRSIMFRSDKKLRKCWNDVSIKIDRSSRRCDSREESVFKGSLGWAFHNITKKTPLALMDGIHDENHPFVKEFDLPTGINGAKLFRNLCFGNSKDNWELRFTDILANSLYKALNDLEKSSGMLKYYKKIMKHSPLGPRSNLGFTCVVDYKKLKGPIIANRFAILQQILDSHAVE